MKIKLCNSRHTLSLIHIQMCIRDSYSRVYKIKAHRSLVIKEIFHSLVKIIDQRFQRKVFFSSVVLFLIICYLINSSFLPPLQPKKSLPAFFPFLCSRGISLGKSVFLSRARDNLNCCLLLSLSLIHIQMCIRDRDSLSHSIKINI